MRKLKKRGFNFSIIVQMILGLVVVGMITYAFNEPVVHVVNKFFKEDILKLQPEEEEFEPFVPEYIEEEQTVVDSMNSLILAVNSLATNVRVDRYAENNITSDLPFEKYKISFSAHIELEEDGTNDYRDWIFEEEFKIDKEKEKIPKQAELDIFVDYTYGSCTDDNEEGWMGNPTGWLDCNSGAPQSYSQEGCFCPDEDDRESGFGEMEDLGIRKDLLDKAKQINLAPVADLNPLYNIVLTTYDTNGNEICKAGTMVNKGKITDTSLNDLRVWGAYEDRDGDGIWGSYPNELVGKNWWETLPEGMDKEKVSKEKVNFYFPDGKIQEVNNGEGCLDSPTWIECSGIRIYYCGKYGGKSGTGRKESEYYYHLDSNKEVHSNAGIKVLRDFDPKYKGELNGMIGYSSANRGGEGENKISIRDSTATEIADSVLGAINYAEDYDLGTIALFIVNPLAAAKSLAMKEMEDPKVSCYGGIRIGNTLTKCNPDFGGCSVCNFELPQNISKDYESALSYIAGYGDPKYVMYYEAFPVGEEEAWVIDPISTSFYSLVAWNLAAQVLPVGGAALKRIAKLGRMLGKATMVPILIAKVVRKVVKPITWLDDSKPIISQLGKKVGDSIKSVFKTGTTQLLGKETGEKFLIKIFSDANSLLRYADPNDLKKIASLEEVAEWVMKNNEKELKALETMLRGQEIVTPWTMFKGRMPPRLAKKGTQYAIAYAAALTMARADSMNQKFIPIGYNAIGAKEPYKGALVTGSGLDDLNPKASKYYLQLIRDQFRGGSITNILKNQNAQRFFMASPCKADMVVLQSECQCWRSKEESEMPTGAAAEILGSVPVLKSSINPDYNSTDDIRRYEYAVKVCRDRSSGFTGAWAILTLEKPIYKTECIVVNPVIEEGFCYSGSHTLSELSQYGVMVGSIAASVAIEAATTALTVGTAGIGLPISKGISFAVNLGLDVAAAEINGKLAKSQKWSNH